MIINRYNYTPINRETIDGKRHYCLPDGSKVPSVTTILDRTKSEEKRQVLANWRKQWANKKHKKLPQKQPTVAHECMRILSTTC